MKKIVILSAAMVLPFALILGILIAIGMSGYSQNDVFVDCGIPIGTLPAKVPKPLNGIFTEAASYNKVDPMAVTLVYYAENYQNEGVFREPAPPYGNGPAWPTSWAAAQGPLQFILPTWLSYRFSNPEHQPGDIMDLKDAAYAAAHKLKDDGGKAHMVFGDPANPFAHEGTIAYVMARYNGSSPGSYHAETQAYVAKAYREYIRLSGQPAPKQAGNQDSPNDVCVDPGASGKAKAVLAFAKSQLGKPYVFGAEGPDSYDCSGLTLSSLRQAGINLPRTAAAQWAATRKWQVPLNKAQGGDLVFFGPPEAPSHVGLVVNAAQGEMINALKPGSDVRYDNYLHFGVPLVGVTHPYPPQQHGNKSSK